MAHMAALEFGVLFGDVLAIRALLFESTSESLMLEKLPHKGSIWYTSSIRGLGP